MHLLFHYHEVVFHFAFLISFLILSLSTCFSCDVWVIVIKQYPNFSVTDTQILKKRIWRYIEYAKNFSVFPDV